MAGIRNICCPWYSHHQSHRNRNRSRLWPDIDSRTAWGPANSVLNRLHGAADPNSNDNKNQTTRPEKERKH